jgi:hypothetical protein
MTSPLSTASTRRKEAPDHVHLFCNTLATHSNRPEKILQKSGCKEWNLPTASDALFLSVRRFLPTQVASDTDCAYDSASDGDSHSDG